MRLFTPLSIAVGIVALLTLLYTGAQPVAAQQAPAFEWKTSKPEDQGLSSAKLASLKDDLAAAKTQSFLVIRNDHIVYEWYADGRTATDTHYTASLAKALVGGMSLAVALN